MFFHFNQNNSGGKFDLDKDLGITHHVVIEANSKEDANAKMDFIIDGEWLGGVGGYCSCCGERWAKLESFDVGFDSPMVYGEPVECYKDYFIEKGSAVAVHYLDGSVIWY